MARKKDKNEKYYYFVIWLISNRKITARSANDYASRLRRLDRMMKINYEIPVEEIIGKIKKNKKFLELPETMQNLTINVLIYYLQYLKTK